MNHGPERGWWPAEQASWVGARRGRRTPPWESALCQRGAGASLGGRTGDGPKPFPELQRNGSVLINADIVAATVFTLCRCEELVLPMRDRHDGFLAAASVAHKHGFVERPVVDEYPLILREWLKLLFPDSRPRARRFPVKLSRDVDLRGRFRGHYQGIRTLGGDLRRAYADVNPHDKGVAYLTDFTFEIVGAGNTLLRRTLNERRALGTGGVSFPGHRTNAAMQETFRVMRRFGFLPAQTALHFARRNLSFADPDALRNVDKCYTNELWSDGCQM